MGFKDVVRSDIDRVFLNLQEFADEHIVQGETVKCVIDTIETQESGASDRYGVFATDIRIHMAEGIITTPVENEEISASRLEPNWETKTASCPGKNQIPPVSAVSTIPAQTIRRTRGQAGSFHFMIP